MTSDNEDPLLAFGRHMAALNDLLRDRELAKKVGAGVEREVRFAMVSFRQKFPDALPGAQAPLL